MGVINENNDTFHSTQWGLNLYLNNNF